MQVVLKSNQCNITDCNILEESVHVHTMKEYAESFSVASKEIRLEVNDKTTYVFMSRD